THAATPIGGKLIPSGHVREKIAEPVNEISAPGEGRIAVLDQLRLGIGIHFLFCTAQFLKWIIEVKTRLGDQRSCQREIAIAEQADRPVAAHVPELQGTVGADLKQAAVLPLKGSFRRAVGGPNRANAPALQHIDELFASKLHRRSSFARSDFHDNGGSDSLLPHKLNERRVALALIPPAQLDRAEIFDEKTAMNGNSDGLHPPVIGIRLYFNSRLTGLIRVCGNFRALSRHGHVASLSFCANTN